MKVVLFGATGMVGAGALLECLADPRVESVLALTRSSTGRRHPKLRELVRKDFFNYDYLAGEFAACDACFFCLGVSPLYPVLRPLLRGTTTANFGRALIEVAASGYSKRILHSADINVLAESH
jgi:nucleoside-diphosphate-sugar epimerase